MNKIITIEMICIDLFAKTGKSCNYIVDMFPLTENDYENNYGHIPANG